MKITLRVQGRGHCPSFKNKKRAIHDSATGKMRTLTEKKTAQWMDRCIESFVSQLLSGTAIDGCGTTPVPTKPSAIASWLPLDDSRQWIPETVIRTQEVPKGQEGAVIEIEEINP